MNIMAHRLKNITTFRPILQLQHAQAFAQQVNYSDKKEKENVPEIPKNIVEHLYYKQPENGPVYDKKPFKFKLVKGKMYKWCLCGQSKSQPFCDRTHENQFLKITLGPVAVQVNETKEYWLCNCKQTKNRPFCDGSHKSKEVQETTAKVRT